MQHTPDYQLSQLEYEPHAGQIEPDFTDDEMDEFEYRVNQAERLSPHEQTEPSYLEMKGLLVKPSDRNPPRQRVRGIMV